MNGKNPVSNSMNIKLVQCEMREAIFFKNMKHEMTCLNDPEVQVLFGMWSYLLWSVSMKGNMY